MPTSPSSHASKMAAIIDAERASLESKGVRAIAPLGFQIRRAVIDAFMRGENVLTPIRKTILPLAPAVADAMVGGHLQGRLRSLLMATQAKRDRIALANPYRSAVQLVQRRLDLSDSDITGLYQLYGRSAATVTGEVAGVLERKVTEAVAQAVTQGVHVREGVSMIRRAFDAAGVTPTNSFQFETVYRTQMGLAYNAGRLNANQDPAIQEILWGYEYSTVGDDRVRPSHAALDGTRMPKNDPRWDRLMPPNGYNCRCTVIEIYNDDREAIPTEVPRVTTDERGNPVPVGPDEGWAFNPLALYRDTMRAA